MISRGAARSTVPTSAISRFSGGKVNVNSIFTSPTAARSAAAWAGGRLAIVDGAHAVCPCLMSKDGSCAPASSRKGG